MSKANPLNRIGRPRKWSSNKLLMEAIDEYFTSTPIEQWTITGLALSIGTTRNTLIDYENRREFTRTIKNAKQLVEHAYELSLRKNGRAGDIFALKNFGWQDKQEIEVSEISKLSSEELANKLKSNLQAMAGGKAKIPRIGKVAPPIQKAASGK
jgi:hypothetical protein